MRARDGGGHPVGEAVGDAPTVDSASADLSPGDTVRVVWTSADGEDRAVLTESTVGASPTASPTG